MTEGDPERPHDTSRDTARIVAEPDTVKLEPERLVALTDRLRQCEERLARLALSEESLRFATEAGEIGTWDLDLLTYALRWSDRTHAMFNVGLDTPVDLKLFWRCLHPDDIAAARTGFEAALDPVRRLPYEAEYRVLAPDGGYRWVAARGRTWFEGERAVRAVGAVVDVTARKIAEANAATQAAILEQLAEGVIVTDAAGKITFVNEAATRLHGVAALDVEPASYAGTYHLFREDGTPYPSEELPLARAVLRGETILDARWRIRRPDGSEVLAVGGARPVRGLGGGSVGAVLTVRDDTARRTAEQALADFNERLEQLVEARTAERDRLWESSPDLLLVIGFDGVFQRINPAWTAILGHAPGDLIGKRVDMLIHPDDVAVTEAALIHATRERLPVVENRYLHRDGHYCWIQWTAAPAGDAIFALGRHVTAEREAAADLARATDALRANEARLRAIYASSHLYLGLVSLDGTLLDANAASLRGIATRREEIVGKPFCDCPWFADTPGASEVVRAALDRVAGGETVELPMTVDIAIGRRSFDFSLRPARDEQGAVIAIVPEAIDITERVATEEALRQAQKMEAVGQLTGGIAHDFNNLLQIVMGNLEILLRSVPEDAGRARRAAENAMTGAKRAATLTQRLLAFSRRQPLAPKLLNINALVAGMAELIGRALGETIQLETVLGGGLWLAEVDPNQLEAAILNLAVNARDAMPAGGKLTIETANTRLDENYAQLNAEVRPGQYVVICVSDTGSGMDRATLARVFEPFFTTKEVGKGTGLGLAMVYGFVKQSGGHVKVYSEAGEGTTIKVYLPRRSGAVDAAVESSLGPPLPEGTSTETILVVEDDPGVRAYSVDALRELGYRVIEAEDAHAALRLLKGAPKLDLALLFTDVVLPGGMTGADLATRATALRPGLKVLFTTGYARNAIVHHGRLDEGVALITKPFTFGDLAAKVRDVLDSALAQ